MDVILVRCEDSKKIFLKNSFLAVCPLKLKLGENGQKSGLKISKFSIFSLPTDFHGSK